MTAHHRSFARAGPRRRGGAVEPSAALEGDDRRDGEQSAYWYLFADRAVGKGLRGMELVAWRAPTPASRVFGGARGSISTLYLSRFVVLSVLAVQSLLIDTDNTTYDLVIAAF